MSWNIFRRSWFKGDAIGTKSRVFGRSGVAFLFVPSFFDGALLILLRRFLQLGLDAEHPLQLVTRYQRRLLLVLLLVLLFF